jgi:hypothetical protein
VTEYQRAFYCSDCLAGKVPAAGGAAIAWRQRAGATLFGVLGLLVLYAIFFSALRLVSRIPPRVPAPPGIASGG